MLKPIVMSFVQPDGFVLTETTAYELKYKGWKRAEKAAYWFLKKLYSMSTHFDKSLVVKQVLIDPNQAAMKIVRMAYEQLNMLGKKPERILLGRKQFYDIVAEVDFRHSFEFQIELQEPTKYLPEDEWSPYRTRHKLFNVPVSVIPWMDGVLVL